MRILVLITLAVLASCGGSEPSGLTRGDCERLREHMLDVRLGDVSEHRDAHRVALRQALGDEFVTTCVASTSQRDVECQMAARDLDALRKCTAPR